MYEITFTRQYATVSRLFNKYQYRQMKQYAAELSDQGFTYTYTFTKDAN